MTEAGGRFMSLGSRGGDITKLASDKCSYWHYHYESTNNFQCLAIYFSNHFQFSFPCCHYNNLDSITNMMFLSGFPFLYRMLS